MVAVPVIWRDRVVGSVALPDSFRPPMTEPEIGVLASLCVRSRSWIYDVRDGDFAIEEKDGRYQIRFIDRLGPGDIGCLVGFTPVEGCEDFVSEDMIEVAARVLRDHRGARS